MGPTHGASTRGQRTVSARPARCQRTASTLSAHGQHVPVGGVRLKPVVLWGVVPARMKPARPHKQPTRRRDAHHASQGWCRARTGRRCPLAAPVPWPPWWRILPSARGQHVASTWSTPQWWRTRCRAPRCRAHCLRLGSSRWRRPRSTPLGHRMTIARGKEEGGGRRGEGWCGSARNDASGEKRLRLTRVRLRARENLRQPCSRREHAWQPCSRREHAWQPCSSREHAWQLPCWKQRHVLTMC